MSTPAPIQTPTPLNTRAMSRTRMLLSAASVAALVYGLSLRNAPYPNEAVVKVLMCVLLMLATLVHHQPPLRERCWLGAALLASAVGDALLALRELSFSFIGGLGAFLLAHLAYCMLLAPFAKGVKNAQGAPGWRCVTLLVGLWLAALAMYRVLLPHLHTLALPVALYMLALCTMASLAVLARLPTLYVGLGGLAFVASDAMIGIDRFLFAFDYSVYAIWFTYAFAQLFIVSGVLLRRS